MRAWRRILAYFMLIAGAWLYVADDAPDSAAAVPPVRLIIVDLKRLTLTLYEDWEAALVYPVAAGAMDTPSPAGVWHVASKMRGWEECYGTRWMGLDCPWGSYGIHGTNRPASIGGKASLGCIRMLNEDVEALYERVPIGTPVLIEDAYGALPARLPVLQPGDRGAVVYLVQEKLYALGYYQGNIDGIYGKRMEASVCAFKLDHGPDDTLFIGPLTYERLGILPYE